MMKENETLAIQLYLFFIFLPKGSHLSLFAAQQEIIFT